MLDLTPKCNMQYGAPMGRRSWDDNGPGEFAGRMYLRRIPIDSGGYDPGGAYWGSGQRLYGYASEDDSINGFTRASDRQHAKAVVLHHYPKAKFYR